LITIGPDGVSAEEVPVPAKVTEVGEFPELLVTANVPVIAPETVGVNVTLRVRLELGFNATGSVTPLNANGPEAVIALIEIDAELLLFVSVTFCLLLVLPTASVPRFSDDGMAESCPVGAVPMPLRATTVGDVGALLTNDRLPVTLPEAEGIKSMLIVPDPPAAIVIGRDSPTVAKSARVMFAALMERAVLPGFETVSDCLPLLPTLTLPNARLPGSTEICGWSLTPAPESESLTGEVGALLKSVTLLAWLPTVPGVKLTENFAVCPGVSVNGAFRPVMLKPALGAVNCVTSRLALPELLKVIV